jgi:hypothetical protein
MYTLVVQYITIVKFLNVFITLTTQTLQQYNIPNHVILPHLKKPKLITHRTSFVSKASAC